MQSAIDDQAPSNNLTQAAIFDGTFTQPESPAERRLIVRKLVQRPQDEESGKP